MKIITCFLLILTFPSFAQFDTQGLSASNPYGVANPASPEEIKDFDKMIGMSECISYQNNQNGVFQDTLDMKWQFKYILNGMAVQDETWRENGSSATSIRVYNPDSAKWFVSYYSSLGFPKNPTVWSGGFEGSDIVLWANQKSPNGLEGFSRLTFYEITDNGFRWKGEWVDVKQTIVFPFWKIDCKKVKP